MTLPKSSSHDQGLVAGGIGGETLGAEQPTKRVQCGCDVDVAVRIDTTSNSTRSFYDGHGHPFSLKVGMARPSRIGATGGLGCSSNPDQSPHL